MKKHRYSSEFKVTAVKLANHPGQEKGTRYFFTCREHVHERH
jgi:transposase-like protein